MLLKGGYKNYFWDSLAQMAKSLNENGGSLKLNPKLVINDVPSQIIASFLEQWSVYLSPVPTFFSYFFILNDLFAKGLYGIADALEGTLDNIFALFGFFNTLTASNSLPAQVYGWLRILGVVLFILFLVVRVVTSIFSTTFKYKEFFNTLILVTAATAFLPQAVVSFTEYVSDSAIKLKAVSVDGTEKGSSLAVQPFQTNTVDLMVLIDNNFNAKNLGRVKGDDGYINPSLVSKGIALNNINKGNVYQTRFYDSMGANNEELLKHFAGESGDKQGAAGVLQDIGDSFSATNSKLTGGKGETKTEINKYSGVSTILQSELRNNEYTTSKDGSSGTPKTVEVVAHKSHSILKPMNAFNPTYLRYKVNWIGLYIQMIMLILILVGILVNVVQTIYRVTFATMVAPIIAYTSVESSAKFLELLQYIFSAIAGIWFEVLMVKFSLWFLSVAPTMTFGNLTSFGNGGGFFQNTIAMIILYIAVFLATIEGSKAIEQWLGISTGARSGMVQAAGAGYVAGRLGSSTRDATIGRYNNHTGERMQGTIPRLAKSTVNNASSFGKKVDDGLQKAGGTFASAGAKGFGSMVGIGDSVKENGGFGNGGFTGTVKQGGNVALDRARDFGARTSNSITSAPSKVRDSASSAVSSVRDSKPAHQFANAREKSASTFTKEKANFGKSGFANSELTPNSNGNIRTNGNARLNTNSNSKPETKVVSKTSGFSPVAKQPTENSPTPSKTDLLDNISKPDNTFGKE